MNEQLMYYMRKPYVIPALVGVVGAASGFVAGRLFESRRAVEQVDVLEQVIHTLKVERAQDNFDRAQKDKTFNVAIGEMVHVVHAFKEEGETLLSHIRTLNEMGEGALGVVTPGDESTVGHTFIEGRWSNAQEEILGRVPEVIENMKREFGIPDEDGVRTFKMPPEDQIMVLDDSGDDITRNEGKWRVEHEGNEFPVEAEPGPRHIQANAPIVDLTEEGKRVVKRLFSDDMSDEWDYDQERHLRSRNRPYVIHVDEFQSGESGYESQSQLTYYAGDDILVDEQFAPIYNFEELVGPMKFGHGSGDPTVFFVRNESRKAEYEIIRDPGFYAVEVLGADIEDQYSKQDLQHANMPRRFRDD